IGAALEEVERMPKSFKKWRALEQLISDIPTAMLPKALEIARDIREARFRVEALLTIRGRLPLTLRSQVCAEMLGALPTVEEQYFAPDLLGKMAPGLPADMKLAAISVAINMPEPERALVALATAVRGDLDGDILSAVLSLADDSKRALILPHLAPVLGPGF